VEAQRAELLAARVLGVFPGEFAPALVDRGVEEDAGDEQDRGDQRRDDQCDAPKRQG
jgi:hypothetical protein